MIHNNGDKKSFMLQCIDGKLS